MCRCLTLCVQSHICGILVRRPLRIKTDCICQLWDNLQRVCSRSVLYQIYENTQACVHGLSIYTHTHTLIMMNLINEEAETVPVGTLLDLTAFYS